MPEEPMTDPVRELAQEILHRRWSVVMSTHVSCGGGCLGVTEYRPGFVVPRLKIHMGSILTIEGRCSLARVFDLGLGAGL